MSSKQERKTSPATEQEEETAPDPEQSSASTTSAAEASSKAADTVDAIDDLLEDFDRQTLDELGFPEGVAIDSDEVQKALERAVAEYINKGGQ